MSATESLTIALLITVTLTLVLRSAAPGLGLIDHAIGRKSHNGAVPVVGGLAMFCGIAGSAIVLGPLEHVATVILTIGALLAMVGTLDDRFDINPICRMAVHAVAAVVMVLGTGLVVPGLGDLLGVGSIPLGWAAALFTVVACVAIINAFNMLDGMDGLAGGTALVGFTGLLVCSFTVGATAAAVFSAAVCGALLGFLVFNLPVRVNRVVRTFMGDAGSTLIGFLFAVIALMVIQPTSGAVSPVVILWLVPMPIFELFTSTARRAWKRLSPMSADDDHYHHRLLRSRFSIRLIFALYLTLSLASGTIGILGLQAGVPDAILFAGFLLLYAAWHLLVAKADTIAAILPTVWRREVENLLH